MSNITEASKIPTASSLGSLSNDNPNTKRLFEDKQKRLDMGPRWSEEELDIFLKYFRQSGLKDVELMKEELEKAGYKRSVDNLTAVFMKNKNFLTFAPSCTARDLSAIMADHYETMEAEIQIAPPERPPVKVREHMGENANDKKRNIYGLNSKGGDFLDEPVRNRAFDDSLNQKRKLPKFSKNQSSSDESIELQAYKPKKIFTGNNYSGDKKKQRKSLLPKGKFPLDFDFTEPDLLKNAEVWSRTCPGKNKRSRNFSLRKSSQERSYSFNFLKLLDCESFYSTIDEPYFSFNEFSVLLGGDKEVSLDQKLQASEWSVVRNCIGKPRRFSNEFIKSQLQDLNSYRNMARNYLMNRVSLPENKMHPAIAQKVKALKPLQVSQIVLAVHPQCNHIHAGSILTITGSHVIIKFFPTELGAISVSDTKVRAVSPETASQIMDYFSGSNLRLTGIPMNRSLSEHDGDKAAVQNRLIQDLDFSALALFVKIMERKTALVNELRNFNDMAENNAIDLDDTFYQEYGWTGVQIKLLDNALKHVVTKTRLRGLNNYDILMANPLKALAELERRSNEDVDPKVIKEIKELLHKNIEQKINEQIKGLAQKYSHLGKPSVKSIEQVNATNGTEEKNRNGEIKHDVDEDEEKENVNQEQEGKKLEEEVSNEVSEPVKELKERIVEDVDETKKKDLKKMVDNMIGVILSLKLSGDLNMTENRYLTDLHNHIFEGNSEEFHEINTVLLNICSK